MSLIQWLMLLGLIIVKIFKLIQFIFLKIIYLCWLSSKIVLFLDALIAIFMSCQFYC